MFFLFRNIPPSQRRSGFRTTVVLESDVAGNEAFALLSAKAVTKLQHSSQKRKASTFFLTFNKISVAY